MHIRVKHTMYAYTCVRTWHLGSAPIHWVHHRWHRRGSRARCTLHLHRLLWSDTIRRARPLHRRRCQHRRGRGGQSCSWWHVHAELRVRRLCGWHPWYIFCVACAGVALHVEWRVWGFPVGVCFGVFWHVSVYAYMCGSEYINSVCVFMWMHTYTHIHICMAAQRVSCRFVFWCFSHVSARVCMWIYTYGHIYMYLWLHT